MHYAAGQHDFKQISSAHARSLGGLHAHVHKFILLLLERLSGLQPGSTPELAVSAKCSNSYEGENNEQYHDWYKVQAMEKDILAEAVSL